MFRYFELEPKDFLPQISNDVGILCNVIRHTELVWLYLPTTTNMVTIKDRTGGDFLI